MKGRLFQRLLSARREFLEVRRIAESSFNLVPGRRHEFRRSVVDTFDYRLREAGRWLELDVNGGARLLLRGTGPDTEYLEQVLEREPAEPLAVAAGPVQQALLPLCGGRALLRRREVRIRAWEFDLVDGEGKIRAALTREQVLEADPAARRKTLAHVLRIRPLRGYEKSCRRLHEELAAALENPRAEQDPAESFCGQGRGRVAKPPPKEPLLLLPRQSAGRALGRLLLSQLRIIESNVDGIRADTDYEFLHDFRVACRRSRSLLIQVRGAFPSQGAANFRETFAWLSRITSPQRDLDVFLAALPGLAAQLGDRHRGALAPLETLLRQRRHEERERLLHAMSEPRFRDFIPEWRRYLEGFAGTRAPQPAVGPRALDVANEALRRLHRRLLRTGVRCGVGLYSAELHELRKDGKKLRYLLEAFRSLYPPADVDMVVGRLRKLQGVLGEIVDYHVQRQWLMQWQQELAAQPGAEPPTLVAMTALGAELDRLEHDAQQGFLRRFERFASAPVRQSVDRLLAAG
ncbi:MAG: CHAD domain-containing protein [Gammaproteobacteria bacterium]|nr:CHAD domain-containing protein [Gammaproteobacteria bacterium]